MPRSTLGAEMGVHTLYGSPLSLYSGKPRSYLIKNGLPYREITPTTAHYEQKVLPRARRRSVPTLETSDGVVIRDGAAIVDYFESRAGHPATPESPRQRILSRLLDVIGMVGLLRPAMHYRWSFPEENEAFLRAHFETMAPHGVAPDMYADVAMKTMREWTSDFGVVFDSMAGVEARYAALIQLLDRHFARWPYLFGGRPSIADFSLIAPFYGHLGRDPKPLALMQREGVHLFRWVERMNRPEPDSGEFVDGGIVKPVGGFASEDEVPESLEEVLRQLAIDFVPETLAAAEHINAWIESQDELPPGTIAKRGLGLAHFEVEGKLLAGLAQPYRFYLLNRVHEDFDAMPVKDQSRVEQLLERCNLLPILSARLSRAIGREANREVWL
ncbi:MAG: glutathione S-transferase family protein [Myxococcota bacterium]|nr:glutathione S-transferase family protein [Myxococcota bacterium]